jgi:hypothetical protein
VSVWSVVLWLDMEFTFMRGGVECARMLRFIARLGVTFARYAAAREVPGPALAEVEHR